MKENINALDEISKGACMGVDAISDILDKVEDNKFKKLLKNKKEFYDDIKKEVDKIYFKYNSEDIAHETNIMTKAMTWSMVNMKTLTDHSNSKIAELLLQGTNMGIVEGRKILNNKKIDDEVSQIINNYVNKQEEFVESLKDYL